MSTRVSLARQGDVVYLMLESTSGLHVLRRAVLADLLGHFTELAHDATLRAVVLTGAGTRAFSAGADLNELAALDADTAGPFSGEGQAVGQAIAAIGVPVIAALNGPAYGGGIELALACDFRLAAPHAHLHYQAAKLGLLPGWGGTQRLPRLVGPARARRMMMAGERIDAATALAWGLVDAVAEEDGFSALVPAWLATWREADAGATTQIKRALESAYRGDFEAERRAFAACFAGGTTSARIRAWLERSRATAPSPDTHPEPSPDGSRSAPGPAGGA